MTRRRALLVAGLGVGAAGGLGFLTCADDLRHGGELAAAAGLTLAGLGLVVAALRPAWPLHVDVFNEWGRRSPRDQWRAAGLALTLLLLVPGSLPWFMIALAAY